MPLTFGSQAIDYVAAIRCRGRIAHGPEIAALEEDLDRHTRVDGDHRVRRIVLQLEETDFPGSSGPGSLVRLYGVLPAYSSEAQAIDAFFGAALVSVRSCSTALRRSALIAGSFPFTYFVGSPCSA